MALVRKAAIYILSLVFILVMSGAALPSEEQKLLRKGDVAFGIEDYGLALKHYIEALELNPYNPKTNYKIGRCFIELRQPKKAKIYFKKVFELYPEFSDYQVLLNLAEAYHQDYDFETAKYYYQQEIARTPRLDWIYTERLQKLLNECAAGAILINKPSVAEVINLGSNVNTPYSDYLPVFEANDSILFYTTAYKIPGKRGHQVNNEKLKNAQLNRTGWIAAASNFGCYKVQPEHAMVAIDPQGKTIYTLHATKGLHVSELNHDKWSEPKQMGYPFDDGHKNISLFITPDGKFAFFSSDRAGGLGGLDLYVTTKQKDGTWGPAINLGPNVNTAYDDDAPFVDAVTHTLYFSSLGHNTMGGFDIFSSKLKNGVWSPAQNLGYPINSTHDDLYFVLNPSRTSAFMSSNRTGGFGNKDIYQVILPPIN